MVPGGGRRETHLSSPVRTGSPLLVENGAASAIPPAPRHQLGPLSQQEAGQLLANPHSPASHSPVHQRDEKGEELTVEARRHAL